VRIILSIVALVLLLPAGAEATVVTYDTLMGTPAVYTEADLVLSAYYSPGGPPGVPGTPGHMHSSMVAGDRYVWGHANCCGNYFEITEASGATFTLTTMEIVVANVGAGAVWTSSSGAQATLTAPGPYAFPVGFANVQWVGIYFPGGTFGWDDLDYGPGVPPPDDDGDGLPNDWETANGLDPTDPADATEDPDGDGLSNLDEYEAGSDPQVFGGPDAPALSQPWDASTLASRTPTLSWSPATDPDADPLTYDVSVIDLDTGLDETSAQGLELAGVFVIWVVSPGLREGGDYGWRARAADPWVAGPWSETRTFFVDSRNDAPPAPVLVSPEDGSVVAEPEIRFEPVEDPDRESVTYLIQAWSGDDVFDGAAPDAVAPIEWVVPPTYPENSRWSCRVRAVDERGLEGDWSSVAQFVVDAVAEAPSGIEIVEPEADYEAEEAPPRVLLTESSDPDGDPVSLRIEIASNDAFEAPEVEVVLGPDDGVGWAPDGAIVGPEAGSWYLRARAEDPGGLTSPWVESTFTVLGPPPPPETGADDDDEITTCAVGSPRGAWLGAILILVSVRRRMLG